MQESNVTSGKNWVLGVTALASFMMALDAMVITTAFAAIRAVFGPGVRNSVLDANYTQNNQVGAPRGMAAVV